MKPTSRLLAPLPAALALLALSLFAAPARAERSPDSLKVETFNVGLSPIGLAFDGAHIWVTDFFDNSVTKVRASNGVVLASYYVFAPFFVAWDGASIWVTSEIGVVTKLRGSDGTIEATVHLGTSQLGGILFDGTDIWVAGYVSPAVAKLQVSDGAILGIYNVGQFPYQLAFDGANIWVTNRQDGTVSKLRASDGQLLFTAPAGPEPGGIVYDGHEIWVANGDNGANPPPHSVTKLRLSDGAILGTAPVGRNPQLIAFDPEGVLFDGASIWVGFYGSGTLGKITLGAP